MDPPAVLTALLESALMLFAEEPLSSTALAVSLVTAALAGLFTWLTQRDRLRFDAKVVALEARLAACEERRGRQDEELEALRRHTGFYRRKNRPNGPPGPGLIEP